jgi:hypothetical protein
MTRAPLKAMHYCGGCNDAERPHDPNTCCGGDGRCPAWAEEPACLGAETEDRAHDWALLDIQATSRDGTAYRRLTAECFRCGMLRIEDYFGMARPRGQCDRRTYTEGYFTVCLRTLDPDRLRKLAARWRATALRATYQELSKL